MSKRVSKPVAAKNGSKATRTQAENPTVELARQLAAIVETHALTELVMDTPELTLTLRKGHGMSAAAAAGAPTAVAIPSQVHIPVAAPPPPGPCPTRARACRRPS